MEFEWDERKAAVNIKNTGYHFTRLEQYLGIQWPSLFMTLSILKPKTGFLHSACPSQIDC